jgi:hypothetical protein
MRNLREKQWKMRNKMMHRLGVDEIVVKGMMMKMKNLRRKQKRKKSMMMSW